MKEKNKQQIDDDELLLEEYKGEKPVIQEDNAAIKYLHSQTLGAVEFMKNNRHKESWD